jgi:hypothetical protein
MFPKEQRLKLPWEKMFKLFAEEKKSLVAPHGNLSSFSFRT